MVEFDVQNGGLIILTFFEVCTIILLLLNKLELHIEPQVNCMSTRLNYRLVEYRIRVAV